MDSSSEDSDDEVDEEKPLASALELLPGRFVDVMIKAVESFWNQ